MTYTPLRITVAEDATYIARDRVPKRGRRKPQHALRIERGRVVWADHPEAGQMAPFEGSIDQLVQIVRRKGGFIPQLVLR